MLSYQILHANIEYGGTMLISFSVQNYKSFKETATFSMVATKGTRHPSHLYTENNYRLLKGSFIFGANASGKSNFVEAMAFAKDLILKGVGKVDTSGCHFRLEKGCLESPGVFEFNFLTEGKQYSYGFALSYLKKSIVSEWLAVVNPSSSHYIFSRNLEEDDSISIESDVVKLSTNDRNRFSVYKEDFQNINNKNLRKAFMLSDVARRTSGTSTFFDYFKDAYKWIHNLTFIFPDTRYLGIGQIASNQNKKIAFEDALKFFDTGITEISTKEIDLEKINMPLSHIIEEVKKENFSSRIIHLNKEIVQLEKDVDGQVHVRQLAMKHGSGEELFVSTDESDGTIRLFDLIPMLLSKKPRTFIIDEIGRSLHSKLLLTFIEKFYERTANAPIQMIATTHDSNVLDLDLLRQDEIWFVERQLNYSTRLYSISEFKERFDKNVEREYLLGRYGAIPIFKEWEFE